MQQLQRSNSLFGTLKSFIPWLGSANDSELQGKRKAAIVEEDESEEEGEHRAKRKRVHSPELGSQHDIAILPRSSQLHQPKPQRVHSGYLDPPVEAFSRQSLTEQPTKTTQGRSASLSVSERPVNNGAYSRRTASPGPSGLYPPPRGLSRTQSMDPPPRRRSAFEPASGRRAGARDGLTDALRERSASPSRPFRMRTSMTPQPLGQEFGPVPERPERDPSEPPPLSELIDNPVFVKAPSLPPSDRQEAERRTSMTLGSVAEAQRIARPLKRSRSSLNLDDEVMTEPDVPTYPINAAEKVLRQLEVYKTPLLPTRLRDSANIPDMFQPQSKKARIPLLMHDRERKPRLGMIDKGKGRDRIAEGQESPGAKPYAGRGGMKRLLARRRMEEEEEHHHSRLSKLAVIEEADEEEERVVQPAPALEPSSEPKDRVPTIIGGKEQSSLRVGRKRNNRNHIERPKIRGKGRYAAIFDDEDEDSMVMDEESERERKMLEEAAKNVPEFKPPPSFSFAMDVSYLAIYTTHHTDLAFYSQAPAPSIQQDATAKEPPIAALPFSLSKPSTPATSTLSFTSTTTSNPAKAAIPPQHPVVTAAITSSESLSIAAAAPLTPVLKSMPDVAAGLPSAAAAPAQLEAQISETISEKPASAIPNFFANSAVFNKPTASVSTQTSFSLVPPIPAATAEKKADEVGPAAPSFFSISKAPETVKKADAISALSSSLFGVPTSTATVELEKKLATPENNTTTAVSETPLLFGGPVKSAFPSAPATSTAPVTSLFGATPASTTPSSAKDTAAAPANGTGTSAFSFGAPAKPTEPTAQPSPFSSGAPPVKAAEQATSAPSPFSFGNTAKAADIAASPAVTPTLAPSPFSFGAPKPESATTEAKPVDNAAASSAPASIFGGGSKPFSFGTTAPVSAPSPSPVLEPAKSPFTFGQPATQPSGVSTPPVSTSTIEAPKPIFGGSSGFSFGQPSPAPTPGAVAEPPKPQSPFTFGNSSAPSIPAADEKPFTFGTPSPAPPATPIKDSGGSLFGGTSGATSMIDTAPKPFAFGAPATPAAPTPLTPPRNVDTSMNMDESPLRGNGMDVNGGKPELPKLNGFAFGAPSTPSPFGQPAPNTSAPFSFGSGATGTSGFGAKPTEPKPAEQPAFGGFGQRSTSAGFDFGQKAPETPAPMSTGFSFGQKAPEGASIASTSTGFAFGPKAAETNNAPSTGFSFGQKATETNASSNTGFSFASPATPSGTAAPFGFGAPQISQSTSFGQPTSATATTPASPFGQPTPSGGFSFGVSTPTSATATSNPFAFGSSQPASPATSNAGLPNSNSTAGFSFGTPANTAGAASSPFGAASTLPSNGGVPAFTMGAAPSNVAIARPIKKMPTRRGNKR
ncbi:hypothetical protein EIP86_011516 [Pleurotus ostreatoroseus]|nr:hypothetical protein EIP86_011516 [Pleurotus ostreatoroseus]